MLKKYLNTKIGKSLWKESTIMPHLDNVYYAQKSSKAMYMLQAYFITIGSNHFSSKAISKSTSKTKCSFLRKTLKIEPPLWN